MPDPNHPCAVAINHLLAQAELTDAGQWNDAKSFKEYVVIVAKAALAEAGLKPAEVSINFG